MEMTDRTLRRLYGEAVPELTMPEQKEDLRRQILHFCDSEEDTAIKIARLTGAEPDNWKLFFALPFMLTISYAIFVPLSCRFYSQLLNGDCAYMQPVYETFSERH